MDAWVRTYQNYEISGIGAVVFMSMMIHDNAVGAVFGILIRPASLSTSSLISASILGSALILTSKEKLNHLVVRPNFAP